MMASSLRAMNWLSMSRASLRPSWQQLRALEMSFWCSFSTAMLQWMSIFMQSPQCRFSSRRRRASASWHSRSRTSTSRSIFSTNTRALRTSSSAFSCFFISLRMAALLRQVGTMSYLSSSLQSRISASSRSIAKLTAFSAIMKWRLFLRMQARLLNVRILSLLRAGPSARCWAICGSITTSTAFEMNFAFPPSSSLMFSIASRFTFCTKRPTSTPTSKPSFTGCRSSTRKARWISFSSHRMHSMELLSPRSRNLHTTVQMQSRICSSLTLLSSTSSTFQASMEIIDYKKVKSAQPCLLRHYTHTRFLSARIIITERRLHSSHRFRAACSNSHASFRSTLGATASWKSCLAGWLSLMAEPWGSMLIFMAFLVACEFLGSEVVLCSLAVQLLQRVQVMQDLSKVWVQQILQMRVLLCVVLLSVPSTGTKQLHSQHRMVLASLAAIGGSWKFSTLISTEFLERMRIVNTLPFFPFFSSSLPISKALNLLTIDSYSDGSSSSTFSLYGANFQERSSLIADGCLPSRRLLWTMLCSIMVCDSEQGLQRRTSKQRTPSLDLSSLQQLRQRWKKCSNLPPSQPKQKEHSFISSCSSKSTPSRNLNPQLMQLSTSTASISSRSLKCPHRSSTIRGGSLDRQYGRKRWATQRGQYSSPHISSLSPQFQLNLRLQILQALSLASFQLFLLQAGQSVGLHLRQNSLGASQQKQRGASYDCAARQLEQLFIKLIGYYTVSKPEYQKCIMASWARSGCLSRTSAPAASATPPPRTAAPSAPGSPRASCAAKCRRWS